MTDLIGFEYDNDREQPAILLRTGPTRTPREDLNPRLEAWGSEYDDADTMFAVFDGDERVFHIDPLTGSVMFLDEALRQHAYTVGVEHGPSHESEWTKELSGRELKRLATVRYHIAEEVQRRI